MINPGAWHASPERMPPPLWPVVRAEQAGIQSGINIATAPPPRPPTALDLFAHQQTFGWSSQPARPWWAESLLQQGVDPDWVDSQTARVGAGLADYRDVIAASQSAPRVDPLTARLGARRTAEDEEQEQLEIERTGRQNSSLQRYMNGLNEAFGRGYTLAGFENLIRHARYPWWWGKVRGYRDIARNIEWDIARTRKATNIPDGMKAVIIQNLSTAWGVAREVWNIFPR